MKAGALKDTIEILDVAEIAMQYVSIPCVRLRVKAVGDLEEHSHFEISRKEVKQGEPALGHVIEVKEEGRHNCFYYYLCKSELWSPFLQSLPN